MEGRFPALLYTIEKCRSSNSSVQKTVHVEGSVVLSQRLNLQSILLDALLSCDHLVVNLDEVSEIDGSFMVLLCSAHQSAELLHKRLTIQGKGSRSFTSACEKWLCPKKDHCLLENCYLRGRGCESLLEAS